MDPLGSITNSGYAAVTQTDSTGKADDRQAASKAEQGTTVATGSGIKLPEDTVSLSGKQPDTKTDPKSAEKTAGSQEADQTKPKPGEKATATGQSVEDPAIQAQIAKLKQTEEKVKAHEAAHKAVGGNLASSASYSYTRGPDGRSYITGGEVQIDMSGGSTPQETISKMQQVIRAALAPADPSGQDRAVAAQAASQMAQAQMDKLQTESPAAQQDSSQRVEPDKETIKAAGDPTVVENKAVSASSKSTDILVQQAYGNPAVQGNSSAVDQTNPRKSGSSVNEMPSFISTFA